MNLRRLFTKDKHPAKSPADAVPAQPATSPPSTIATTPPTSSSTYSTVVNVPAAQSTITASDTTTLPPISASASRTLLEAFQITVNILGNASLPGIKLAASAVLDFFRRVQDIGQNEDTFHSLANYMEWLLFLIDKYKVDNVDDELRGHLVDFTRHILELQNQLPKETGMMKAFINSDYFKLRLDALASDLRTVIEKLQLVLQLTTLEEISSLKDELKNFKENRTSSRKGDLKQALRTLDLISKKNINIPTKGINVDQSITNSTWTSDGDITIATTAGLL